MIKQQLLESFSQDSFSRQALQQVAHLCSQWLEQKRAVPHGLYDQTIIYLIRDFSFSAANYMEGQEDASSGISSVRHTQMQAAIAPALRGMIDCLNSSNSESVLRVIGEFVSAFEEMKRDTI